MDVFVCMPTYDKAKSLWGFEDDERRGVCMLDVSLICLYDDLMMFRHLYDMYMFL